MNNRGRNFILFSFFVLLGMLGVGFIQSDTSFWLDHEYRISTLESFVFSPTPLHELFQTATAIVPTLSATNTPHPTWTPTTESVFASPTQEYVDPSFSQSYKVRCDSVTCGGMNVRSCPSINCSILDSLVGGQEVEITRQQSAEGYVWGLITPGWVAINQGDFEYLLPLKK